MNRQELSRDIHNSMYQQRNRRGYATPVDTFMDCGIISRKVYDDWRFGKIPYLEKCCNGNLKTLSFALHEMRTYAARNGWKSSLCFYKKWGTKKKNGQGRKPVIPLRFSKSGNPDIEKQYSTHFVDTEKIKKLKEKMLDE
ncbi:hypothetical protein FMM68_08745 [Lachnospiraceae bacterium MD329]|nr:hypothetical protein [Lachnospiraceae bacterium MD329]